MRTGLWHKKTEEEIAAWPPCRAACPAHTDCRGYAALIAVGRHEEALALVRERAPLVAALGRICHHPCEENCRRASVDESLSIRSLKRFVAEANRDKTYPKPALKSSTGKRVAIIGGGPAGLTAASDLAMAGHAVTVFERRSSAGGALFYGVPKYRLPKDVLAWDVGYVASLGVDIKAGQAVDRLMARDLVDGYDAVIVASGLPVSRGLPIPGADAAGCLLALPFLEAANADEPPSIKGKVVVVGGGNVAIDVARTALREGADEVALYCLEGPAISDLPAFSWEIEEALEEGIEINPSWGPVEIEVESKKVVGITFKRCTRVFDDDGRFNPAFDEGQTVSTAADEVIIAIGQAGDLSFLDDVVALEGGRLVFDRRNFGTSNPKVFATGEIVTGPGSAIDAIANGHQAALAVDSFLSGRRFELPEEPTVVGELPQELIGKIPVSSRAKSEMLLPGARVKGFDEVEATYSEETAVREAMRCLSCGNGALADEEACAGCLTCVRVCPFEAPAVSGTARMHADYCQACGLCATECPARAIEIGAADLRELSEIIVGKRITVFACREAVILPQSHSTTDRQAIGLPCAVRVDEIAILKAFEAGAEGVLVYSCTDDRCRYDAEPKLARRIQKMKKTLDQLGLGGWRLASSSGDGLGREIASFEERLAAGPVVEVVEQ